jgi:hypothetical protein
MGDPEMRAERFGDSGSEPEFDAVGGSDFWAYVRSKDWSGLDLADRC